MTKWSHGKNAEELGAHFCRDRRRGAKGVSNRYVVAERRRARQKGAQDPCRISVEPLRVIGVSIDPPNPPSERGGEKPETFTNSLWPYAFRLWPLAFGLSPLAFRLSPFAFRLTPYALRLWPFAFRLTPLAFRLSPFAFRLWPFAFRLWPYALRLMPYSSTTQYIQNHTKPLKS